MKLSSICNDIVKSNEGAWCKFSETASLRIARAGSVIYKDKIAELVGTGKTNAEMHRIALGHLVTDWKGFDDESNKPIPFCKEHIQSVILNEQYQDIMDFVIVQSSKQSNYRQRAIEQIKKR